ncbi:MAG: hypothetical protein MJD61_09435 [Proteobacteria bacterium]|nr:hypothetical protein [Pseudomonadota bacterium]
MHGNLPYDVISFKDVGLELQSSEQQLVYETIAESLSLELPAAHGGKVVAQARFSPALDKHADHLDCEGRHVYVDMWRPGGRGWGYSLWSGCSEASNFAWEELPRSDASRIEQLTRPIATSLEQATRTACFTRHC